MSVPRSKTTVPKASAAVPSTDSSLSDRRPPIQGRPTATKMQVVASSSSEDEAPVLPRSKVTPPTKKTTPTRVSFAKPGSTSESEEKPAARSSSQRSKLSKKQAEVSSSEEEEEVKKITPGKRGKITPVRSRLSPESSDEEEVSKPRRTPTRTAKLSESEEEVSKPRRTPTRPTPTRPTPTRTPTRVPVDAESSDEETKTKRTSTRASKEPPARARRESSSDSEAASPIRPTRVTPVATKKSPSKREAASPEARTRRRAPASESEAEQPELTDAKPSVIETPLEEVKQEIERSVQGKEEDVDFEFKGELETKDQEQNPVSSDILEKLKQMRLPPGFHPLSEVRNKDGIIYELVMIKCALPLQNLLTWLVGMTQPDPETGKVLVDVGGLFPVGCMRVWHRRIKPAAGAGGSCYEDNYRQYTETDNTIAAIHPELWKLLEASPFGPKPAPGVARDPSLYITRYTIQASNMPGENCSNSLLCCFKSPKHMTVEDSMQQMYTKMQYMVECGFVNPGGYKIHNPPISREFDAELRNFCIITFADGITEANRAAIKICLDQTKFKGPIDPATITAANPAGKHIPYMCIISWVYPKMMSILGPKYQPKKTGSEGFQSLSKEAVKRSLSAGNKTSANRAPSRGPAKKPDAPDKDGFTKVASRQRSRSRVNTRT